MKTIYYFALSLLLTALFNDPIIASSKYEVQGGTAYQIATIDSADTVFFDMSNVIIIGNQVQIPVKFNSDDPVYSLDFSFRYNDSKLSYDTIIPAPAGLAFLAFSFLNPNDSIVRFTSSNLVAMSPLTELVYLVFTIQPGQSLVVGDLNTLKGYLNGDRCSEFVIPPVSAGIVDSSPSFGFEVFPNPATDYINIITSSPVRWELLDVTGKTVMTGKMEDSNNATGIDCSALHPGQYLIRVSDEKGNASVRRIVISR